MADDTTVTVDPTPAPTLKDLANAVQDAHDAYFAAKADAETAAAMAATKAAAAMTAHAVLAQSISTLVAAAQAEDT